MILASLEKAIRRELVDAAVTGYQRITQIRVTSDAIRHSPVSVPLTPERARVLGLGEADGLGDERLLELLVHPDDWRDLLCESRDIGPGYPTVVQGVPVDDRNVVRRRPRP